MLKLDNLKGRSSGDALVCDRVRVSVVNFEDEIIIKYWKSRQETIRQRALTR